jgi:hypothetical protein
MKRFVAVLAAVLLVVGMSSQAQATPISVSPATTPCGNPAVPTCLQDTGNDTSNAVISAYILSTYGATEVYKQDTGAASDEGTAAAYYTTAINAGASGGTVTWVGPGWIIGTPVYFLVKDGASTPAWYLFNISNWGGKDTITFSNFWPTQGGISHIAIFGGTTTVPDGGSVAMLLGAALVGLAGFRRFVK